MATTINAGTVEVWIKAKTAALTLGFNKATQAVQVFGKRLTAMGAAVTRISRQFVMAGVLIGAALALPIKTFADFEQAMKNTQSVAGATAEEYARLTDFARKMGEQTIFTASQSAEALYYLASAGQTVTEMMETLPAVLDLAAATQYDLAETSRMVVSTLNQFRFSTDQASRVVNVFAAAISASQATMDRLGTSMSYVGPIAKELGWSLEATTAILSKLYDAGIAASMAGTALRMGMVQLLQATGKASGEIMDAETAIKNLGVAAADIDPMLNKLPVILDRLSKAGMTAKEAIAIFGVRAAAPMLTLMRAGAKSIDDLEKKITGTNKAAEMARIQLEALGAEFKLFRSAIQETSLALMGGPGAFGEYLTLLIREKIRPFLYALNEWIKLNKELVTKIIKVTAAVSLSLLTLGLFGLVLGLLTKAMGALILVVGKLGAILLGLTNPFVLLIAVIYAARAAWNANLWNMRDEASKILKNIGLNWKEFGRFMKDTAKDVANFILQTFVTMGLLIEQTWKNTWAMVKRTKILAQVLYKAQMEGYIINLGRISREYEARLAEARIGVSKSAKELWEEVKHIYSLDFIKGVPVVALALEDIKEKVKDLVGVVIEQAKKDVDAIIGFLKEKFPEVYATISGLLESIKDKMGAASEEADRLAEIARKAQEDVDAALRKMREAGEEPGKWKWQWTEWGAYVKTLWEDFVDGWKFATGYVARQFRGLADSMESAMSYGIQNVLTGAASFRDAMKLFFQDIGRAFARMIAGMIAHWLKMQAIMGLAKLGIPGFPTAAPVPSAPVPSAQYGLASVPYTGLYQLHKGERVTPAETQEERPVAIEITNVITEEAVAVAMAQGAGRNVIVNVINEDVLRSGKTRRVLMGA